MTVFDVYKYLERNRALRGVVGNRIYPAILPQNPKYPAITYFQVSGVPIYAKDGKHGKRVRLQISCWAETYTQAKQLAETVASVMDDYSNECFHENEFDIYENEVSGYQVPLDFIIFAKER